MKQVLAVTLAAGLLAWCGLAAAATIDFDDPQLVHLSDVTSFYAGVEFHGIPNPYPLGPGPYPYTPGQGLPPILGGAAAWDPFGGTAPGESPPNFAVGLGGGAQPGDAGILICFSQPIYSLTLTGLDFSSYPPNDQFPIGDIEQMSLTAWDGAGNWLGQEHFSSQFTEAAIRGTIALPGMQYVAFNYTNTEFGFYGIDDLEFFETAPVPLPATALLLGSGLAGLAWRRRKKAASPC